MRAGRGMITFYDDGGRPLAHRKYDNSHMREWIVNYRIMGLKRRGKIVSYIQIEPHTNENMVRENGKNKYL